MIVVICSIVAFMYTRRVRFHQMICDKCSTCIVFSYSSLMYDALSLHYGLGGCLLFYPLCLFSYSCGLYV
ncbi:hypothetical protein BDV40DRAFT_252520 [Aspergillus tamarii]|uniref:Uncharacterized protein n=1 Tax=Aspergillus tamarii TaxID=41984 RepID=A0A5N6V9J1_ASPTM|nr:hypothetical protein BDV40DRAFT_252520 [Aspergillus tamarii]